MDFFFQNVSVFEINIILFPARLQYRVAMSEKKRSREEFEAYLKAMLDQDYPKVKYSNPDAWRVRALGKSKER